MAYSSFLVARGFAAVFFGVGLSPDASSSDALARVVVFLAAGFAVPVSAFAVASLGSAFASPLGAGWAAGLLSGLASGFGVASARLLASVFFAGVLDCAASFAASSASFAACAAAASSRRA